MPTVTVLAAKTIRPDYVSGQAFRFLVITGGTVTALAQTSGEAARAAGPSARWVDLGDACVAPGFVDTHIHALQAAADARLVSLREATTMAGLLAAVRQAGGALRRTARRGPGRAGESRSTSTLAGVRPCSEPGRAAGCCGRAWTRTWQRSRRTRWPARRLTSPA
jgi:imidazolonepropionase-like amidohydrolase